MKPILQYRLQNDNTYAVIGCNTDATGDLKIPKTHNGKAVTSIGNYAFYNCSGLTSVTIGGGVTSIGNRAFEGCSGLTSVAIGSGVTSIGFRAFDGCSSLESVTIPDSVTSIGESAFSGCSGLISVTIPEGVTSIGNWAFYNCSGLTSVRLPDSVTSIGGYAFCGCSGLTNVIIGSGVTSIESYAFRDCSGLTSVTIPEGVTSIGRYAFYNCIGLTKQLPKNTSKTLAIKSFNANMTCRGFQYEIGKEYHVDKAELCKCGFHACTTGLDLFSYYYGKDDKDVVFCEVELSGITNERENDSKICGTSIKILRKLSIAEAANYCSVKEE